jgi:transposase
MSEEKYLGKYTAEEYIEHLKNTINRNDEFYQNIIRERGAVIIKLRRENEILKQALEFYADKNHWATPRGCLNLKQAIISGDLDIAFGFEIGGKTARKALREIEGME